eukprot:2673024-Alexandrium_andersonii.AAC.1
MCIRDRYWFTWQDAQPLQVHADTDWAGCPATRRSTSGGCALRGAPEFRGGGARWRRQGRQRGLRDPE